MLKLIIINLLFLNIAQAIEPVAAGANIEAAKINSIIDGVNKVSDKVYDVGDVRTSLLTESAFQSRNGSCWVLMKGQDVSGSLYAQVSGSNVLPDATTQGTFLRQAKSGRVLGSYEADEFAAHDHEILPKAAGGNPSAANFLQGASQDLNYGSMNTGLRGGSETRPKNTAVNMFIKINNCN